LKRDIIKKFVIGYIKVTQVQERKQVIKLIGSILNFDKAELEEVEGAINESKTWFSSLRGVNTTATTKQSKQI
jgi:hypothetical protein